MSSRRPRGCGPGATQGNQREQLCSTVATLTSSETCAWRAATAARFAGVPAAQETDAARDDQTRDAAVRALSVGLRLGPEVGHRLSRSARLATSVRCLSRSSKSGAVIMIRVCWPPAGRRSCRTLIGTERLADGYTRSVAKPTAAAGDAQGQHSFQRPTMRTCMTAKPNRVEHCTKLRPARSRTTSTRPPMPGGDPTTWRLGALQAPQCQEVIVPRVSGTLIADMSFQASPPRGFVALTTCGDNCRKTNHFRGKVQILSPRLFFKSSPSAKTSKGFLFFAVRYLRQVHSGSIESGNPMHSKARTA